MLILSIQREIFSLPAGLKSGSIKLIFESAESLFNSFFFALLLGAIWTLRCRTALHFCLRTENFSSSSWGLRFLSKKRVALESMLKNCSLHFPANTVYFGDIFDLLRQIVSEKFGSHWDRFWAMLPMIRMLGPEAILSKWKFKQWRSRFWHTNHSLLVL